MIQPLKSDSGRPVGRLEAAARAFLRAPRRRGRLRAKLHTLLMFVIKQAWVCLFGGLLLALLLGTHLWYPANARLPRYDALTLAAVAIQIAFIRLKLEEWDEVKVILLFHLAGTGMELFKTSVGAWSYPERAYLRIAVHGASVPLFSGFMYASVGSYLTRAMRGFDMRFTHHPPLRVTLPLSLGIYLNFFLHHYWFDLRYVLMLCVALAFWRCTVFYRINVNYHRMPLLLGFVLIALFVWLAENVGTYSHAWVYPAQAVKWEMVSTGKLGSWFLLIILSYVLVTLVNPPHAPELDAEGAAATEAARNSLVMSGGLG